MSRAQSHVVGVALLLAASTVALGTLTVGVGDLLESRAADADAQRVATGLADAIQPRRTTGERTVHVRFSDGTLETVPRDLRIYRNGSLHRTYATGALRYGSGERLVSAVGGAITRGRGEDAWLVSEPSIAGSRAREVLLIGVVHVGPADTAVSAEGTSAVPISTNVTHGRADLGRGSFAVDIETEAVGAFRRYFETRGVPTSVRDVDGDGVPSVRARFTGERRGYVVIHRLRTVIGRE